MDTMVDYNYTFSTPGLISVFNDVKEAMNECVKLSYFDPARQILLAIRDSLRYFHPMIDGRNVTILSDSRVVTNLPTQLMWNLKNCCICITSVLNGRKILFIFFENLTPNATKIEG